MIISKAPLRISLGGGGTDLPSYYEKYGGYLVAGTIDKYVFTSAHNPFIKKIKLRYSKYEEVKNIESIKHRLFKEAIRLYDLKDIELSSIADIPSGTGLGSSGAFLVSLLNTLHYYKYGSSHTPRRLAEEACMIELDILKEHEGKQDKYASAFGGVKAYEFMKDGSVKVIPLSNEDLILSEIQNKLLLFYTGEKRNKKASETLKYQDDMIKSEDKEYVKMMHEIKNIGIESKRLLENLEFDKYGDLLDKHWEIKKKYAPHSTNERIDKIYEQAKKLGSTGGKVVGAPGGGFFLFYHPGSSKEIWDFIHNMQAVNLKHIEYKFDNEGVQTIWNR